jgi:CheY-like chemotaxis protein
MTPGPFAGGSAAAAARVLVVEDNEDARAALAALLEIDGYVVHAAPEGASGVELVREHRPDVALVDIGLPGIDGYEVARRIRALGPPQPFLIALTGYGRPEDRERAIEAGFDTHLVKPVDPNDLAALLSRGTPGRESRG